jgi:hypothetical protein
MYPDIVYPPSSLIKIPKTYEKGKARGFIVKDDKVIGVVSKNGKMQRLRDSIDINTNEIPTVKDPMSALPKVLQNSDLVSKETQTEVQDQIKNDKLLGTPESTTLIFNPAQNDFVPVNKKTTHVEDIAILDSINKTLIPKTLPPIIENGTIAGVITDDKQVVGIVDVQNNTKKLNKPIDLDFFKNRRKLPQKTSPIHTFFTKRTASSTQSITTPTQSDILPNNKRLANSPLQSGVESTARPSVSTATQSDMDSSTVRPSVSTATQSDIESTVRPSVSTATQSDIESTVRPSVSTASQSDIESTVSTTTQSGFSRLSNTSTDSLIPIVARRLSAASTLGIVPSVMKSISSSDSVRSSVSTTTPTQSAVKPQNNDTSISLTPIQNEVNLSPKNNDTSVSPTPIQSAMNLSPQNNDTSISPTPIKTDAITPIKSDESLSTKIDKKSIISSASALGMSPSIGRMMKSPIDQKSIMPIVSKRLSSASSVMNTISPVKSSRSPSKQENILSRLFVQRPVQQKTIDTNPNISDKSDDIKFGADNFDTSDMSISTAIDATNSFSESENTTSSYTSDTDSVSDGFESDTSIGTENDTYENTGVNDVSIENATSVNTDISATTVSDTNTYTSDTSDTIDTSDASDASDASENVTPVNTEVTETTVSDTSDNETTDTNSDTSENATSVKTDITATTANDTSDNETTVNTDISAVSDTSSSDASQEQENGKPIDITGVPQINVEELEQEFKDKPAMSEEEANKFKDELQCIDGQQYDVNTKRCLPCTDYNLVWDPLYKVCKVSLKLPSNDVIIVDEKDDIIGYM